MKGYHNCPHCHEWHGCGNDHDTIGGLMLIILVFALGLPVMAFAADFYAHLACENKWLTEQKCNEVLRIQYKIPIVKQ